MKKLLLFVLVIMAVSLYSQIGWEATGKPIRNGVNIEWFRAGTPTNDGSIVYVWSDTRNGDRDVWAQKISAESQTPLWGEGGKLINGEINRQEDIVIINSGNALITAWVDFRNEESGDIYAQKLDYDGNIQWQSSGIPLCTVSDVQISLNIVADNEGGAYIIWVDHRNGNNDIYGVRLTADGTLADGWQQNGNPIVVAQGNQYGHTFWEDGQGGAILVWTDVVNTENSDLRAQRLAPDGTLLWGENGIVICNETGNQSNPKISPDGTGNFIITWMDKRVPTNNGDIYAQRIDLNGQKLWSNDLLIYGDTAHQENPRIRQANDEGVFVVWQDGRNEENTEDIYVQKISTDGNLLWGNAGVPVVIQPFNQKNPRIVTDNANGCWIIWDDARNNDFPNIDIYIQHFNENGEATLQENGEVVCNEDGVQFAPLLKKSTTGYIFANWGDNRGGFTGIYYQIFDNNGSAMVQENGNVIFTGLSGNARNYIIKRNYYGIPAIFWEDTRFAAGNTLYFQEVDKYGNLVLPENGFRITNPFSVSDETKGFDVVTNPTKNEIALVYKKQISDSHKIFAQIFNSYGELQFSEDGFSMVANPEEQYGDCKYPAVSILDADNSEYLFAWSTNVIVGSDFTTYKIFAQKIQDGTRLWGDEGKLIYADPSQNYDLNVETAIDNYIVWTAESIDNKDIYIIKIDENGNPAPNWPASGVAISAAEGIQEKPKLIKTSDGILCVWQDTRGNDYDIYGQLISPDGSTLWQDNGKLLVGGERDQVASNIVLGENSTFVISWEDNLETNVVNIKQRKFDFNGNPVWNDPIDVISGNFSTTSPSQAVTDDNDYYVFWSDYRVEAQSNLYAQKINSSGQTMWDENGFLICDALKNQNLPASFTDDDNYVYVFWEDTRASGKDDIYSIYGQILTDDAGADDNQIPSDNIKFSVRNYPNPFITSTRFVVDSNIKKPLKGKIVIYNLKGQIVKTLSVKENTALLKQTKTQKPLTSGIYFYRFVSKEGSSKIKKTILLK